MKMLNTNDPESDAPQPEDVERGNTQYDWQEDGQYLDGTNNVDIDERGETVKFCDYTGECPNCKMPVTNDMDSCPYCGDILYRYLKDASFMPHKGLLAKIVTVVIIGLIVLAVLSWLIQVVL